MIIHKTQTRPCADPFTLVLAPFDRHFMKLRGLTYSIHKRIGGGDRRYRPDRLASVIARRDPDIVMLQEVDAGVARSNLDRQVDWLGDRLDFPYRAFQSNVRLANGSYGNAILSRLPIT